MPALRLATQLLANLLSALSHPKRVRIVEELQGGEKDVSTLIKILDISQTAVSQHLAIMRQHNLVRTRRQGHRIFYSLAHEELGQWLVEGLDFVHRDASALSQERLSVRKAKQAWSQGHG